MVILFYFFLAIGVSFLCSILEAVLLSLTPSHIEVIKQNKPELGAMMEEQKKKMDLSIAAILTLNTFAHTLGAAGVGAEAVKLLGDEWMFYVSAGLTLLILVLSEIIPKTIGAYYWKGLSGVSIRVIRLLVVLTYPLLIVMQKITQLITPNGSDQKGVTKAEIAAIASLGKESGVLKEKEGHIIQNLLSLDTIKVEDIYTPRSVMFSVSETALLESFENSEKKLNLKKMKTYSRIPVFGENIDDIRGMVLSKEYFHEMLVDTLENKRSLIKPVFTINQNIPVSKLMDLFLSRKEHLFIVEDNYGQTEGLVTLEDAVETLFGIEIVDELDQTIDMRELAKANTKKRLQKYQEQ